MINRTLFDNTVNALGLALNFRMMNQEVISSNIANIDTPGYKGKKLEFEDQLKTALDMDGQSSLKTSNEKHFATAAGGLKDVRGNIFFDPRMSIRNDLNSVDIDNEMKKLSENQLYFDAASQIISKKLALLKYAINEGGF